MFDRLIQILKQESESESDADPEPEPVGHLNVAIDELTAGITSIKAQYIKISEQEAEILKKLQNYQKQQNQKLQGAKAALSKGKELVSESLYRDSQILAQQVEQYDRIASEILRTKRKLQEQENKFQLTKDKLSAKKTLGEANVDASQWNAELSEQLMFLNESDELNKFDELIDEASSKSQAIEEIQGTENSLDTYLIEPNAQLEDLKHLVENEKSHKIKTSQLNQQIIIEKVFGKLTPAEDTSHKKKQKSLINRLLAEELPEEKEDRVDNFFKLTDSNSNQESKQQNNVNDKEDRIKNFFDNAVKPAGESNTQDS